MVVVYISKMLQEATNSLYKAFSFPPDLYFPLSLMPIISTIGSKYWMEYMNPGNSDMFGRDEVEQPM